MRFTSCRPASDRTLALVAVAIAAAGGVPARAWSQAAPETVGVVSSVLGRWYRGTDTVALRRGDEILRGDSLRVGSSQVSAPFVTLFMTGGRFLKLSCTNPCDRWLVPTVDDGWRLPGRTLAAGVRAALGLLAGGDPRYSSGISRGGAASRLRESVLTLDDRGLDLAPLVRAAPPGAARLVLCPLAPPGAVRRDRRAPVGPLDLRWEAGRPPAPVAARGVRSGLYAARVGERRACDEARAASAERDAAAWVLVRRDSSELQRARAAFAETEALVEGWTDADVAERRAFLRATLHHLAAPQDGRSGPASGHGPP